MKEMLLNLLIVAAILVTCGFYFKLVILNWLARDAELRRLNDGSDSTTETTSIH